MILRRRLLLGFLWLGLALSLEIAHASPPHPNLRLVSLAPSLTELVFAAGAGHHLVGAVDYSDFPLAAQSIPRIGSLNALNYEALLQLQPDFILVWRSGTSAKEIRRLKQLGFKLWIRDSQRLDKIPVLIAEIGDLTGHSQTAHQEANRLQTHLKKLQQRYARRLKIRAFYQIWDSPLMTVNGDQFMSEALGICGVENVFQGLPLLAPQVNYEAVIQQNPQVILLGGRPEQHPSWQQKWQRFSQIDAVIDQQFIALGADTFQRPTGRLIDGLGELCQQLDLARQHYSP